QPRTGATAAHVAAGLNRLALMGQLLHHLPAGLYRWRQIMPVALSLGQVGPESPETEAGRQLVGKAKVRRPWGEGPSTRRRKFCSHAELLPRQVRCSKS